MLPTKYWFIWWSGFRGEDFLEINPSLRYKNGLWHHVCKRIGMKWAIFIEDLPWMLPTKFQFIWQVVSEEKIFLNRPIRNKNCLWRPCLITDQKKISSLYRGPSTYTSYQVSVHLAEGFQRRRLKCEKLTDDGRRTTDDGRQVIAKAHIAFGKVS